MAGSVTMRTVAKQAGVSLGTVSRVLNNQNNVNETMRKRVLEVATALGYFEHAGTNMPIRTDDHKTKVDDIGFFLYSERDRLDGPPSNFWATLLYSVQEEAHKAAITVTYRCINSLDQLYTIVHSKGDGPRLNGILLVGPAPSGAVQVVSRALYPVVLVDNYVPKMDIDAILGNNGEGARYAVEYLLSQNHRRIAFIGGPTVPGPRYPINTTYSVELRAAAYRNTLLDAGIPVDLSLLETCDLSIEESYDACRRLLARHADFTAVFCASDHVAFGTIKALLDAGLRVPQDVSVIGYDDVQMARHFIPALTTVHVDLKAMSTLAVKTLVERIREPLALSKTLMLNVELIHRDSVAPLQ